MASTKQNDVTPVTGTSDNVKAQGLSLSHSKLEPAVTEENDRNSNLSPSKSADPARKKTFKIISVKKGGSGSGDLAGDNDADSIDGLDESQTEDLSSEFYDSSKATDLDMDLQDSINPLTPDEVTSTTTIVVKQKPDQNSQSRFKVVKIETKEPFRRGKWVCYDFFDTAPASVVTLEKNGSKVTEDSIIHSALSGNFSSSSSVHYVQDVNDSSSNIFVTPVVPLSPTGTSDVFVPIQTAPVSQVLGQFDGLSSDVMTPFIAQQVLASVGGVPSSSSSFHASALTGHTTIVQSLPQTNVFPYAQNGPPTSLYQNGVNTGQTTQVITIPNATIIATGAVAPAIVPSSVSTSGGGDDSLRSGQAFVSIGGVPHSQSQIHIGGVGTITPQGTLPILEMSQSATASSTPASKPGTEKNITTSAEGEDQMGPGMDESTGSTKTLQGDSQTPQGLEEAVETMYIGLEGHEGEDVDERTELARPSPVRPSALPRLVDNGTLDSPYGLCLTPVVSLCTSPVPPAFADPVVPLNVAGMLPVTVFNPISTTFAPLSSSSFVEPIYNPLPATDPFSPSAYPVAEPSFLPTSYYPFVETSPVTSVFSPVSAFVPLSVPVASVAPASNPLPLIASPPLPAPFESLGSHAAQSLGFNLDIALRAASPMSPLSPLSALAPSLAPSNTEEPPDSLLVTSDTEQNENNMQELFGGSPRSADAEESVDADPSAEGYVLCLS